MGQTCASDRTVATEKPPSQSTESYDAAPLAASPVPAASVGSFWSQLSNQSDKASSRSSSRNASGAVGRANSEPPMSPQVPWTSTAAAALQLDVVQVSVGHHHHDGDDCDDVDEFEGPLTPAYPIPKRRILDWMSDSASTSVGEEGDDDRRDFGLSSGGGGGAEEDDINNSSNGTCSTQKFLSTTGDHENIHHHAPSASKFSALASIADGVAQHATSVEAAEETIRRFDAVSPSFTHFEDNSAALLYQARVELAREKKELEAKRKAEHLRTSAKRKKPLGIVGQITFALTGRT